MFESHQSGIEMWVWAAALFCRVGFESHQSGIEIGHVNKAKEDRRSLNRTRVELKLRCLLIPMKRWVVFESHQSGIEISFNLSCKFSHYLFESHQSGIEMRFEVHTRCPLERFESHQSGIEIKKSNCSDELPEVWIAPEWNWNPVQISPQQAAHQFESHQSGIEMIEMYRNVNDGWKFESHQSGIEIGHVNKTKEDRRMFESHQSGIEMKYQ